MADGLQEKLRDVEDFDAFTLALGLFFGDTVGQHDPAERAACCDRRSLRLTEDRQRLAGPVAVDPRTN